MDYSDDEESSGALSSMTASSDSGQFFDARERLPKNVLWTGVILRVFEGGKSCAQSNSFTTAVRMLNVTPTVEYINIDDIKKLKMGPEALIDWLLKSHGHFILSHIHQGTSAQNVHQMGWNMQELQKQVRRLSSHSGFPSGNGLNCPVFTQNKGEYLSAIPDFVNPSFLVPLAYDPTHNYHTQELQRFVEENNDEDGWIVKMPYTTNHEYVHKAKTYSALLKRLQHAGKTYAERVSYAIVQPYMRNKKEYRVVVLGGKAEYVVNLQNGAKGVVNKAFSLAPHKGLFKFVQTSVRMLKRACPATLSDCVLRVDVFQRADLRLVVNEFESLEARIYATKHDKDESAAQMWVAYFWHKELHKCLQSVFV